MANELDRLLQKFGPRAQPGQPEQMGYAEDTVRSAGSGLAQFAENAGSGLDTAHDILSGMIEGGLGYTGMSPESAETWGDRAAYAWMPLTMIGPERETVREYIPDALRHEPQTVPGEIAYRVGRDGPMMMAGGGGTMVNRGLSALGAAAGGYAGEQGAEYLNETFDIPESYRPYVELGGDIAGSVAGSMAPSVVRNIVTPNPMTREREQLANLLDRSGVQTTAGQRTGNQNLHYKESQTGGTTYSNMIEEQKRQFSGGALQRGGIQNEQVASPRVLQDQRQRLGAEFDRLQSHGLQPDSQLFSDLVHMRDGYYAVTPPQQRIGLIDDTIADLAAQAQRGVPLDGERVRRLGTGLRQARDRLRLNRPEDAEHIGDLIDVIDDAVERHIANVAPRDAGRYAEVRNLYRNLITLEEAASRKTSGVLSPDDLVAATKKTETRRGFSRGFGPFNDYARAGKELMTEPPNSGTANRTLAKVPALAQFGNLPAMGGAALGYLAGNGPGAVVGATMGAGVEAGINRLRMSPRVQEYLANQLARDWDTATGAGRRAAAAGGAATQRVLEDR